MTPEQQNQQVLALLQAIQRDVAVIKSSLGDRSTPRPTTGGDVASDRELDSEWGNPAVRKDPPRWTGQSYVGYKLSETEPDFLECYASFKDWAADMDEKKGKVDAKGRPTAPMNRKDAARARGWAARLRAGAVVPAAPQAGTGYGGSVRAAPAPPDDYGTPGDDDGIPF